jgi:hypothetical protein
LSVEGGQAWTLEAVKPRQHNVANAVVASKRFIVHSFSLGFDKQSPNRMGLVRRTDPTMRAACLAPGTAVIWGPPSSVFILYAAVTRCDRRVSDLPIITLLVPDARAASGKRLDLAIAKSLQILVTAGDPAVLDDKEVSQRHV